MNVHPGGPSGSTLTWLELWIEAAAFLAAVLLIPLYMGFVHVPPTGLLAYAALGGVIMAIGEDLQFDLGSLDVTLHDILLWIGAIGGVGGITYLLALLFL